MTDDWTAMEARECLRCGELEYLHGSDGACPSLPGCFYADRAEAEQRQAEAVEVEAIADAARAIIAEGGPTLDVRLMLNTHAFEDWLLLRLDRFPARDPFADLAKIVSEFLVGCVLRYGSESSHA